MKAGRSPHTNPVKRGDRVTTIVLIVQLLSGIMISIYFITQLSRNRTEKTTVNQDSKEEMERLRKLREKHLTVPLAEKVRPSTFEQIIGQEQGIAALQAALGGGNPQHILIYGPPGIGKTCAARLVLEDAKQREGSPFGPDAPFIEMDATCCRFDERSIADPLMGSVHDPIYQGSGPLGAQGIPQPKPGAVTKAHGGVLFLDEIGELQPIQMNRLLKVLEDRKVMLESAYYRKGDAAVPAHIRDIFDRGLPADFRLIGATTRSPEELPPALRSRCVEVFFRALTPAEVSRIAREAATRSGFSIDGESARLVGRYADNGRAAVNIVQMAGGLARMRGSGEITPKDVEWVLESGRHSPRVLRRASRERAAGVICGLAVTGGGQGVLMEIEAIALPGTGRVSASGLVEEEEMGGQGHRMRRKGTALSALQNARLVLEKQLGLPMQGVDVHVNFPGGIPVDGPSAGIAMAVAMYSAVTKIPIESGIAITGELSLRGQACPVGGVPMKVEAAREAGAKAALIPRENWNDRYGDMGMPVYAIDTLADAIAYATASAEGEPAAASGAAEGVLIAKGAEI